MTDPVSALVGKWEREAAYARSNGDNSDADNITDRANQLREALKLRPRGSAEQAQEIERLKAVLVALGGKP